MHPPIRGILVSRSSESLTPVSPYAKFWLMRMQGEPPLDRWAP
jgi:hypothetical protein